VTGVKGWYQLALKVFLYTCGAVVGGVCAAFGIGLLTAGPASAATQGSAGGVLGSATPGAVRPGRSGRVGQAGSGQGGGQGGSGSLVSATLPGAVNAPVSVGSNNSGNGSASGSSSGPRSQAIGGSLVSVNAPGSVNLPVSALSNGSGNGVGDLIRR
jgi:hypothetical protein